jgi:FkbM family methyltransferase
MIQALKNWLKPRLIYFVSRHINLGFKPCRQITTQEIAVKFCGEELTFRSDFRTPLYETINEVLAYDCYQLSEVPFSNSSEAAVIDIGANIGVSAVALARLSLGQVHAFEPISANFDQLLANLRLNAVANVVGQKAAVGPANGVATMAINPDESVSSYVAGKGQPSIPAGFETETAEIVGLDSLFDKLGDAPIDLIKVDCEGAEYGLVEALSKLNHVRVRAITMEVHDLSRDQNCETMRKMLAGLGYKVTYKPELLGRPVLHHLLAIRPGQGSIR